MWMRSRDGFYGRDKDDVTVEVVDILFAPHHGRDTGKFRRLACGYESKIDNRGAPSEDLNYMKATIQLHRILQVILYLSAFLEKYTYMYPVRITLLTS